MTTLKHILIHYGEIALKKGNRRFFEDRLRRNTLAALNGIPVDNLRHDYDRFVLTVDDTVSNEKIIERLKHVMGITHFSIAEPGDPDINILKKQVFDQVKDMEFQSFKIDTRRADKNYPMTSVEVNREVGAKIHLELNKPVDLTNPDLTCRIEIFNKKIFFYCRRIEGQRGLPVGSSGKVVCLLSSGIDSPVAAYRMMTRGCSVIFVHFHSFPFTDKNSYHNALKLANMLTKYQNRTKIYFVPLAEIQQVIIESAPAKFRLLLYRRMMFRLAEMIARRERAKALITGESVGQVASQTLENIAATSEVVKIPVLRPLIGMDKEMIVDQARELGTFTTSIEPYDDCCSFLVPKNPETRAKLPEIHAAEEKLGAIRELLKKAIYERELKKITYPEDGFSEK